MAEDKRKTVIVYAPSSFHPEIIEADIAPAREAGVRVRLVSLDHFTGERETNFGSIFVARRKGDEEIFSKICEAYPEVEVKDYETSTAADLLVADAQKQADSTSEDRLVGLREKLVRLGGSVPAGATEDEISALIADAEAAEAKKAADEADAEAAKKAAATEAKKAAAAGEKK